MPRRKGSDDECEIDDALQQVFYYEPVWDGKKRRKIERVKLPTASASTTSQVSSRFPLLAGDPSLLTDTSAFASYDDDPPRRMEVLPVKGKACTSYIQVSSPCCSNWLSQTQYDYLEEYRLRRKDILRILATRHAPPAIQTCSVCRLQTTGSTMTWRCDDCFGSPVFCSPCIRNAHRHHPFHRISRWNGKTFLRSTCHKAGITLSLGHRGQLCPKYVPVCSGNGFEKESDVPSSMFSLSI